MNIIKYILLIAAFFLSVVTMAETKKKVACVGNSITENWALDQQDKYPAILQRLLGSEYDVRNYGIGGRTMLKKGNHPYWNEQRYQEVLEWEPDIVIIKMGTNDGKPQNWEYKNEFEENYTEFVNSFRNLQSKPKIFVCYPLPTFAGNGLSVSDSIITTEMMPIIKGVAKETKSGLIDLHKPFEGREDFVYDKIHPNSKGTTVMARLIAKAICPNRNFPKPALGKKVDIVFIGNSITEGTYLPITPPTYTAMYLDSLGYEVQYANCGISGFTTVNFQPGEKAFDKVINKADSLYDNRRELIFSVKLGTNDSACKGTTGAPVSADQYKHNMQNIIDALHQKYPSCRIVLHSPIWYSPNTHNSAVYLQEGLDRLKTYRPAIDQLVQNNKGVVFAGDKKGFDIFRKNYKKYHRAQQGNSGTFYLHPNQTGAKVLGELWGKNIETIINK